MANEPTSFRFPFNLTGKVHPEAENAIRYAFSGLKDLNDAIKALNTKVAANAEAISVTNNVTSTSGGGSSSSITFGDVNLQPDLTPGAYTLVQTDLGGLIYVDSTIAFALTLNSGLMTPFFTTVFNYGTGVVTMTPSSGTVNSVASLMVLQGEMAIVYFDGTNWEAVYPRMPITFPHVISHWLDSFDALTGIFTASQPSVHDLVDSTTGSGKVVLESGPTLYASDGGTKILSIIGLPAYLNNTAALAGGLVHGNLYRTGLSPDTICVVD